MALPKIEIRGKPVGVDVSSEHKRIREVFFMVTPESDVKAAPGGGPS
jgi:hypothetical protein